MKKIIPLALVAILAFSAPALAMTFSSNVEAEAHYKDILLNKEISVEITDVEEYTGTEDEVFWKVDVWEEIPYSIEECLDELCEKTKSVTRYSRNDIHSAELSSVCQKSLSDSECKSLIEKHAKDYLNRWKQDYKVMARESLIGQKIMVEI